VTSSQTMAFTTTSTPMSRSSTSPLSVDNTAAGLSVLAVCTADVRQWYLQNGLQLNPDKSEALVVGTANQLCVVDSSVSSVSVAGVDLPVAEDMKVLGVVLDRRLTFHKHVSILLGRATTMRRPSVQSDIS